MKIAIIGADGQLSNDLIRILKDEELFLLTIDDIRVEDREQTVRVIKDIRPDVLINTAAFHQVDRCEDERIPPFDVNCMGAINAASAAEQVGASYVFYSTDYVFGDDADRNSPYTEEDKPGPLSVYGFSKLAGEIGVRNVYQKHFVIRTCGLYGVKTSMKGYNFPGLMMKLANERDEIRVVNDQRLTPTHTLDVARKTAELINTDYFGLYHMTNTGDCTWYEFTRYLFDLTGINTRLIPITTDEYPVKAKRPAYSVLDNKKLRSVGIQDLKHWQEALQEYLKESGIPVKTGSTID
jgi:dTDP-4-dehydrorhamnose reductase